MNHHPLLALTLLATSGVLQAQYFVPDQTLMRRVTRVSWQGESGEQAVAIDYGQPRWNADYDAILERSPRQHVRLGNGSWTTLQTGVDLEFGKTRVPRGRWYLGVQCDGEKQFALTLMAADRIDADGRGSFATSTLKPDFTVPMQLLRSEQSAELLDIALASDKRGRENVALTIAWGNHRLSTKLVAAFDLRQPKDAPVFKPANADKTVTTASGLKYEVLRSGAGAFPTAADQVTVHYCAWLEDGSQFDSTYLRGGTPVTLAMDQVMKGFAEGLRLMQPGAVLRLTIPPDLGYGSAGAGDVIPPDATLVFTVTLVSIEK